MELGGLADRSDRPHRMIHVVGNGLERRVAPRGGVDRDAVIGPADLAGQERLVVGGVVP